MMRPQASRERRLTASSITSSRLQKGKRRPSTYVEVRQGTNRGAPLTSTNARLSRAESIGVRPRLYALAPQTGSPRGWRGAAIADTRSPSSTTASSSSDTAPRRRRRRPHHLDMAPRHDHVPVQSG